MHITGSHHRLVKLFSQLYDPPVILLKILLCIGRTVLISQHKCIVADGLDLQIIIKFYNTGDILVGSAPHQCPKQFSCLTGRAEKQSFPVFHIQALGYPRPSGIIVKMRLGDQPVQIDPPCIVLSQNDGMVGRQLFHCIRGYLSCLIQLIQVKDFPLL